MKQGFKKSLYFFIAFFLISLLVNTQKEPVSAIEIPTYPSFYCVDNAVAPLNNLKDIQTFFHCIMMVKECGLVHSVAV